MIKDRVLADSSTEKSEILLRRRLQDDLCKSDHRNILVTYDS